MPSYLCITVRFLQPYSHGRGNGGEPEWPPSPLRVFQALVNAAAGRWNERTLLSYAVPALTWLEMRSPPVIVSAVGMPSDVKYRMYVPDNVGDKIAKSWRTNPNASIADYRTEKDVRPTHLTGDAVHYLYPLAESEPDFEAHRRTLADAARSITHLGWGVDVAAGNAAVMSEEDTAKLDGERWRPALDGSGTQLRVPHPQKPGREGTLKALMGKHQAFLTRLSSEGFRPVPPLTAYDTVGYRRGTDPATRPWVAFRIAALDPDRPNPSFDTARRCRDVAAWVRHATAGVCEGWPFGSIASFVHGHDPANPSRPLRGEHADDRFTYLPLPSIERRGGGEHIGSIRRVLIAAPPGFGDRIEWIRRRLPGQELIEEGGGTRGILNELAPSDWVLRQYVGESRVWSSVTPVILPGHDEAAPAIVARRANAAADAAGRRRVRERAAERTRNLLLRAFLQSGLPPALVANAQFEWREVGFRAGVEMANRFAPLSPHRLPSYHVQVRWPVEVRGPLAIGAGRYRGFGLLAAVPGL